MIGFSPERSYYRPFRMGYDYFKGTFVDRVDEIQDILGHIDFNLVPSLSNEHPKNVLIMGERGIGKTSLFLELKYRLLHENQPKLNDIIPVFFNEREDINSAETLVQRIYQIILENSDGLYRLRHSDSWEAAYRKTRDTDTDTVIDPLPVLMENLRLEAKKLVLFIENFDALLYRVLRRKGEAKTTKTDSGEIIKRIIEDPAIILICSAVLQPDTPHHYGKDTFKKLVLKPLPDLFELITKRLSYDNKLFLLGQEEKLKNKTRAIEYLTAGNTRCMVQFYENFVRDGFKTLKDHLTAILDSATPLFEWTLEKYVDFKSQELLLLLAREGGNMTVKEISGGIHSDENTVRTLLNRLKEKGFVDKGHEKRDQSDIYLMKQRPLFLWYHLYALQRQDTLADFYLQFIDLYFDPGEIIEESGEPVYLMREEEEAGFITDSEVIQEYLQAGKFPLQYTDKKLIDGPTVPEIENLIYEVVRAKQDDSKLREKIAEANDLKIEQKPAEAANLFRIAARGYLILVEEFEKPYYEKAKENILDAIEIYRQLGDQTLEWVRCLMILIIMLSRYEPEPTSNIQVSDFANTIIRIAKKEKQKDILPYIANAYIYLGFAETKPDKKLKMFLAAKEVVETNNKDIEQLIIILVNIGLVHLGNRNYNEALNYFETALELCRQREIPDYSNPIIFFIFETYKTSENFRGGLTRCRDILEGLTAGRQSQYQSSDLNKMFVYKAFFLYRNNEIAEAEKHLLKIYEDSNKEKDRYLTVVTLLNLIVLYRQENKPELLEKTEKEISTLIDSSSNFPAQVLHKLAELFYNRGEHEKGREINEKLYKEYESKGEIKKELSMLVNTGNAYLEAGNIEAAESNFNKAIKKAKEKKLKDVWEAASYNLALLYLHEKKAIDEALNLLEALKGEPKLFPHHTLHYKIHKRLFFEYLNRAKLSYKRGEIDNFLSFTKKSLDNIGQLSNKDFVQGFYFTFILPLLEEFNEKTAEKIKELFNLLHQRLYPYYEKKEKGELVELFKLIVAVVNGTEISEVMRNLPLMKREILGFIYHRLGAGTRKATLPRIIAIKSTDDEKKEEKEAYMHSQIAGLLRDACDDSSTAIHQADDLLNSLQPEQLEFTNVGDYYFLSAVLALLKQNQEKVMGLSTQLLKITAREPVNFFIDRDYFDLENALKERLNPREFTFLDDLERLILNRMPIITFTDRYPGYVDKAVVEELSKRLEENGRAIFRRLLQDGALPLDQVTTMSGSRLQFEHVIGLLKKEFSGLTTPEQDHVISFISGLLSKAPESYKWMVLDFSATYIHSLGKKHLEQLADALLNVLAAKKDSRYFLNETAIFLLQAKNTFDHRSSDIKQKVEKELMKLKEEQ